MSLKILMGSVHSRVAWAWAVCRAVTARLSVWANLPASSQQLVVGRDGALRVAQARDEGWLPVLANMPGPGISSGPLYQEQGQSPPDLQMLANSRSQ